MKAFLCHSSADASFVIEVAKHLKRCFDDVFYYEENQRVDEGFKTTIKREIHDCEAIVIFVGEKFTEWQEQELVWANEIHELKKRHFCTYLLGHKKCPAELKDYQYRIVEKCDAEGAIFVAKDVAEKLDRPLILDGLPLNPHLFDYEKDIIDHFRKVNIWRSSSFDVEKAKERGLTDEDIEKIHKKRLDGCPESWPEVVCWEDRREHLSKILDDEQRLKEWQEEFGEFRSEQAVVVPATLSMFHKSGSNTQPEQECCLMKQGLFFPEAGPREFFYFPQHANRLRVGVLVSGGIAPGINAVIDGIVQRHHQYGAKLNYQVDVVGLLNGFRGLEDVGASQYPLRPQYTSSRANEGGSILGTSRVDELIDLSTRSVWLESIVSKLFAIGIDILYIIGGDGSMKAAHAIWTIAHEHAAKPLGRNLSIVTIPKTMDNDILWVWQAFGFLSAVEEARKVIEHLATEVHSNPRLCIVQLFGSDSGFVVSHAVHASLTRQCDVALIPEDDFSMEKLAEYLKDNMVRREELIPRGLVVMAETAIPTDAMRFIDDKSPHYIKSLTEEEKKEIRKYQEMRMKGRHIEGQTNDALRSASLKIVSQGLKKLLGDIRQEAIYRGFQPSWKNLRVFTNEPRHLLRAIPPSCIDIIVGNRLGTLAVDNAIAGYTDFMIGQWLTEFVLVPLDLVVLGRKRIPKSGIFWKSTRAKTGQPANLY